MSFRSSIYTHFDSTWKIGFKSPRAKYVLLCPQPSVPSESNIDSRREAQMAAHDSGSSAPFCLCKCDYGCRLTAKTDFSIRPASLAGLSIAPSGRKARYFFESTDRE